jgi:hypothetical protein
MNTKRIVTLLTALLTVTCATTVFAAPAGRGSGGWGMGSTYQRMYNPATVESVSGEVISVHKMTPSKGMGTGIHLQLKTDKETIPVHLGPSWYIDRLDARIEKGDTIEVKGSRVLVAGKPVIIAAEVKKGDATLKLRDDSGIPVWAGWRK